MSFSALMMRGSISLGKLHADFFALGLEIVHEHVAVFVPDTLIGQERFEHLEGLVKVVGSQVLDEEGNSVFRHAATDRVFLVHVRLGRHGQAGSGNDKGRASREGLCRAEGKESCDGGSETHRVLLMEVLVVCCVVLVESRRRRSR